MFDLTQFQKDFIDQLSGPQNLCRLFDYIPGVYLFVKNTKSQFTLANNNLLKMLGVKSFKDILGKTDRDFFVRDVADKYIEEDRMVMSQDKPFENRIWLVPDSEGTLAWYLCTKVPLYSKAGEVMGIAGILIDYQSAGSVLKPYTEIADVVQYITKHYHEKIDVEKLAHMAHLSISQFDRKFKKLFHISPLQYVNKVRINAACQMLVRTDENITNVALNCGFYDHSYFTKRFTKTMGISPKEYRTKYYHTNDYPQAPGPF